MEGRMGRTIFICRFNRFSEWGDRLGRRIELLLFAGFSIT